MPSTIDLNELNFALSSFTRSEPYIIDSIGDTFSTVKDGYRYEWKWLNVIHKSRVDERIYPRPYDSDEVTLRCVLRALQGHFPDLHARLFHIDELGITNCPELLLAVCVNKEELPETDPYT